LLKLFEWMKESVASRLTGAGLMYGFAIFAATFVITSAIAALIIVKLPTDYFHPSNEREFWVDQHPVLRWGGLVAKNIVGVLLVLLGVVMSLPGIPGPGVLTILLGIMLLDFPGKRGLELRLVRRQQVRRALDRVRAKFNKPPLLLD
jgi:uncharacterized membrane protein HdeD (DUF308 family)